MGTFFRVSIPGKIAAESLSFPLRAGPSTYDDPQTSVRLQKGMSHLSPFRLTSTTIQFQQWLKQRIAHAHRVAFSVSASVQMTFHPPK
jgi:hypothetical protein